MNRIEHTERLRLRTLQVKDVKKVLDYYRRNRQLLEPWDPIRPKDFYTLTYQRQFIVNKDADMTAGHSLQLWISPIAERDKFIGYINFDNIIRGAFQSCFLGYKLDADYLNRGLMTEAIAAGIAVIFNEYGLHRIEANIIPDNRASLRVVEKLGFKAEGIAKRYLMINGEWRDHIHMVRLNEPDLSDATVKCR